jgi:hypothetical protein
MQVVRKQAIKPQTMAMNAAYWNLSQIRGTVWQNYMLVMTSGRRDRAGKPEQRRR